MQGTKIQPTRIDFFLIGLAAESMVFQIPEDHRFRSELESTNWILVLKMNH